MRVSPFITVPAAALAFAASPLLLTEPVQTFLIYMAPVAAPGIVWLTLPHRADALIAKGLLVAALAIGALNGPSQPGRGAVPPACQVHTWDSNPPYPCHTPAAEMDDA